MGKYEKSGKQEKSSLLPVILAVTMVAAVLLAWIWFGTQDPEGPADDPTNQPTQTQGTQQGTPEETPGVTQTEPETAPEMVVISVEEQADMMVVSTSYGVLKYPYAFSDLIAIEAVTEADRAGLVFTVNIDGMSARLYTVWFGWEDGVPLGTLVLPESGERIAVCAEIHEADPSLEEGDFQTFYAAQETFNDVVVSLEENENFTPAN